MLHLDIACLLPAWDPETGEVDAQPDHVLAAVTSNRREFVRLLPRRRGPDIANALESILTEAREDGLQITAVMFDGDVHICHESVLQILRQFGVRRLLRFSPMDPSLRFPPINL